MGPPSPPVPLPRRLVGPPQRLARPLHVLLRVLVLYALVASADPGPVGYVGRRLSNVAGRFHTVVERFEQCPGSAKAKTAQAQAAAVVINVTRVSREWGPRPAPQRVTGSIALRHALDDSTATELTIDQWSNNQWKRNAFVMRLPALCSALRALGGLGGARCPARQGVYPFENVPADWRFPSMPEFYYGTWRAEAVFTRAGARRGCVRVLFKTTPAHPEEWPDEQLLDLPVVELL